jgi:hypothetical protein
MAEKSLLRFGTLLFLTFLLALISCGGGGPSPTDEKSHTVSGLNPGTTYYWKVTVSDSIDTVESATRSFTTL